MRGGLALARFVSDIQEIVALGSPTTGAARSQCPRVIEYPKLAGKFRTDARLLVDCAMASAIMVPADLLPAIDVVKADPSDNVYLATALAGGARWVVTGNTRHLTPLDGYAGLRLVEPAVFPAELGARA